MRESERKEKQVAILYTNQTNKNRRCNLREDKFLFFFVNLHECVLKRSNHADSGGNVHVQLCSIKNIFFFKEVCRRFKKQKRESSYADLEKEKGAAYGYS